MAFPRGRRGYWPDGTAVNADAKGTGRGIRYNECGSGGKVACTVATDRGRCAARPLALADARRDGARAGGAEYVLPANGDNVVGVVDDHRRAEHEDTLFDIGRRYGVGYEEIIAANPGIDPWLPGEGTEILIPTRFVLPGCAARGRRRQPAGTPAVLLPAGARRASRASCARIRSAPRRWTGRRRSA